MLAYSNMKKKDPKMRKTLFNLATEATDSHTGTVQLQ
jgi:hypothetical protein